MKKILRVLFTSVISFVLVGCMDATAGNYNESIELGIEYMAEEDYVNAEIKFEEALESKPGDKYAESVIEQIKFYRKALKENENGDKEKALALVENAAAVIDGSEKLNLKSIALMKRVQEEIDKQQAETEEARAQAEKEAEESARKEDAEKEAELVADKAAVVASKTTPYTYADFKGIYAMYEGVPFNSKVVATYILSDKYLTDIVADWMEYTVAEISSVNVEGDTLYLDYEGETEGPITFPAGTLTAQLQHTDNDEKALIVNGHTLYQITRDQFDVLGYSVEEDLFNGF